MIPRNRSTSKAADITYKWRCLPIKAVERYLWRRNACTNAQGGERMAGATACPTWTTCRWTDLPQGVRVLGEAKSRKQHPPTTSQCIVRLELLRFRCTSESLRSWPHELPKRQDPKKCGPHHSSSELQSSSAGSQQQNSSQDKQVSPSTPEGSELMRNIERSPKRTTLPDAAIMSIPLNQNS